MKEICYWDSREIKGRFQKFSVTLIFNSHNMFFRQILREFARSRTRVRQISNDFARSHGMFCVCLALSRMPDILSERPLHVFLLKCNCRLVERIFSLIVSLIATPNQVLYFCSIKKSLVWFYFSIHNHFDENHREKSLCSSPSIGTITLSSSLFPHVWFYFLVPPVAVPNHNCTVICNISGLSVGAAQTTDKEISSA